MARSRGPVAPKSFCERVSNAQGAAEITGRFVSLTLSQPPVLARDTYRVGHRFRVDVLFREKNFHYLRGKASFLFVTYEYIGSPCRVYGRFMRLSLFRVEIYLERLSSL